MTKHQTVDRMRPVSDNEELQTLLTRYVDSHHGYREAAKDVDNETLAMALRRISGRRGRIAEELALDMVHQGGDPDLQGSTEGKIHRWWMAIRSDLGNAGPDAILSECLRGERELERTLAAATRDDHHLNQEHYPLLEAALEDVRRSIAELEVLHS